MCCTVSEGEGNCFRIRKLITSTAYSSKVQQWQKLATVHKYLVPRIPKRLFKKLTSSHRILALNRTRTVQHYFMATGAEEGYE